MPRLSLKNGLLLKLADIFQSLAAWLTTEVHAPGPQGDNHPQVEDDFRAQGTQHYKVSRPPEDLLKLIAENSVDGRSEPIGGKVERDLPAIAVRRVAPKTPAQVVVRRKTESAPAASSDEHLRSSQRFSPHQAEPKQTVAKQAESKQVEAKQIEPKQVGSTPRFESPAETVANRTLSHQPQSGTEVGTRSFVKQVPEVGFEPAMPAKERFPERQEPPMPTALRSDATQNLSEPVEAPRRSKQAPLLVQAMRKIINIFRPTEQSSAAPQPRSHVRKSTLASSPEPLGILNQANVSTTQEKEPRRPMTVQEQADPKLLSTKIGKANPEEMPRVAESRLSSFDQEQIEVIVRRGGKSSPETSLPVLFRHQRETIAPVLPWPNPTVRVAATTEPWFVPDSNSLRRRESNLPNAPYSSWKPSPQQEHAPGMPLLPSEFRASPESSGDSGALYPWPELPQIVEEDADEPRKLLQSQERQMRILREQRGVW